MGSMFWSSGLPFLVVGAWETGLDFRLSLAAPREAL
jgi:hypothetical protein